MKFARTFFALIALCAAVLTLPAYTFAQTVLHWSTPDELFEAQSMTISVNGKEFHGVENAILTTHPISDTMQSLQVQWNENGTPMTMDFYFTLNGFWNLTNIKTTNGINASTYVSYNPVDAFNQPIMNGLGEPYVNNGNQITFKSNSSEDPNATISISGLALNAFLQDGRIGQRPQCLQTTIAPKTGPAPLGEMLFGSGASSVGISGYQWDFGGNGVWDSNIALEPTFHTYTTAGTYYPHYIVWGKNDIPSFACQYPYPIVVSGTSVTVVPSIPPAITSTITPVVTQSDDESVQALNEKVNNLEKRVDVASQKQTQTESLIQKILSFLHQYFPFFR